MSVVSTSALTSLQRSFAGELIAPKDPSYDAARAVWNGDIDRRPCLVARPTTADEVAMLVTFARAEGLDFTVRGGGHNYAGHGVADDAVMIDLSRMNAVTVDAATRRARVGGGATWADVDAATQEHGLGFTGGVISHTGVGGLTLGGGIGWLTRRCGLACDSIVGAQVVTADGRVVTASADENPDLLWALKGGGGNFGVVTEFEFALHDVPPMANLGLFFWTPDAARGPLLAARDLIRALPGEMGALIGGMSAPPEPFVPEHLQGKPGVGVLVVSWGTPEEHADAVAPLRALSPAFEMVTPIPYVALQQMFNAGAEWGSLAYEKALYLDELSEAVVDLLLEALPRMQSPMTFVPVFPLGGRYAEVADDATAWGGSRSAQWVFNISAAAPAGATELLAADRAWVRELWDAVRPHAGSSGSYVNFIADEDSDRVRASYGAKYERLAAIKAQWDPNNAFRHNANIAPAGPAVPVQAEPAGSESGGVVPSP